MPEKREETRKTVYSRRHSRGVEKGHANVFLSLLTVLFLSSFSSTLASCHRCWHQTIYIYIYISLLSRRSALSLSLPFFRLATTFDQDRGRYACNGASSRGKYLNEDTMVPGEILWQNSNDTGFRTISRPGNVENLSADKFIGEITRNSLA